MAVWLESLLFTLVIFYNCLGI